jgi:hypothetical protein
MTKVQVDEHPAVTPVLWTLGALIGALVVVWHVTPCTDFSVKPAASVLRNKGLNTEATASYNTLINEQNCTASHHRIP